MVAMKRQTLLQLDLPGLNMQLDEIVNKHNLHDDGSLKWAFLKTSGTLTVDGASTLTGAVTSGAVTAPNVTDSALSANRIVTSGTGGLLGVAAALSNGQLLIGSTSNAPVAAALTGTLNQVTVTNGAGTITLATPQDIATGSNVTFNKVSATANLQIGANNILPIYQRTSGSSTVTFSTSSTTYVATNLSASITPKLSTSGILIVAISDVRALAGAGLQAISYVTLTRGGTDLSSGGNGFGSAYSGILGGDLACPSCIVYVDSPATTLATTYDVRIKTSNAGDTAAYGIFGNQNMYLFEIGV